MEAKAQTQIQQAMVAAYNAINLLDGDAAVKQTALDGLLAALAALGTPPPGYAARVGKARAIVTAFRAFAAAVNAQSYKGRMHTLDTMLHLHAKMSPAESEAIVDGLKVVNPDLAESFSGFMK